MVEKEYEIEFERKDEFCDERVDEFCYVVATLLKRILSIEREEDDG